MRKKRLLFWMLLMILSFGTLTACGRKNDSKQVEQNTESEKNSYGVEVEKLQNLSYIDKATYITDKVYDSTKENTIFSPLSLNMALAMVEEGAQKDTKQELESWLGEKDYSAYMEHVQGFNVTEEIINDYQLRFEIANSVWVDKKLELNSVFSDSVKQKYLAHVENVDFESGSTVDTINSWCNHKTHGMIPEILSPENVTQDTRSILVNTIYFESPWSKPWTYREWEKEAFTLTDGTKTETSYMHNHANAYYENEKATAFECVYQNGLHFIGILPKTEGEFQLSDLDIDGLLKTRDSDYTSISVKMPQLDFETDNKVLKNTLQEMGITTAFDENNANFRNMAKLEANENIYIDNIIQKCKIQVDQKGTRASAATGAIMAFSAAYVKDARVQRVYLNRPFAFLIYDHEKEEVVFMGKVVTVE